MANRYWVGGTASWDGTAGTKWATTSGGAGGASVPTSADDVFFDANSTGTVTIASGNTGAKSINCTGFSGSFAGSASIYLYGNFVLSAGMGFTYSGTVVFAGGTCLVNTFGKTINFFHIEGGLVTLQANLTVSNGFVMTNGSIDAVSFNVSASYFAATGSGVQIKLGSGTWTVSDYVNNCWNSNAVSNSNFYAGSATINIVNNGSNSQIASFNYECVIYKITISGSGSGRTTIRGESIFINEIATSRTSAFTLSFFDNYVRIGKWDIKGSLGAVVTLQSNTFGPSIIGASPVGIDYLNFNGFNLSGSTLAELFAGTNSTFTSYSGQIYFTSVPAPRTLYWVGGTGNWGSTSKWSTSSGGAGGAALPLSIDNVVFDSLSNAGSYTVTCDVIGRCATLNIGPPASGLLTFAGTNSTVVHGNTTIAPSGVVVSKTGSFTLSGSSSGNVFTTNNVSLSCSIVVYGYNCGWSLGSSISTSGDFAVLYGSMSFGAFNFVSTGSASSFSCSSSLIRSVDLGSATIDVAYMVSFGNSGPSADTLTLSCGTSQIIIRGYLIGGIPPGAAQFYGNGKTFYGLSFTPTFGGEFLVYGENTFTNKFRTSSPSSSLKQMYVLYGNQTISGIFEKQASTSALTRVLLKSSVPGIQRTITCASAGPLSDIDFRDISVVGSAAPLSGTRIGDCGNNSGITPQAPSTKYWNNTGNNQWNSVSWATSSGGVVNVNNFPLPQDVCVIENSGFVSGQTLTIGESYSIGSIDTSSRTLPMSIFFKESTLYGNLTLGSGVSWNASSTQSIYFGGNSTQTITSAGKTINADIYIEAGHVVLQDNLTARSLYFATSDGSIFDVNGKVASVANCGMVASFMSNATLAIGSGVLLVSGNFSNAPTSTNGYSITGDGVIKMTSAGSKTFANNYNLGNVCLEQAGNGTLTISGAFGLRNFQSSATAATSILLNASFLYLSGQWLASGSPGKVLSITGGSVTKTTPGIAANVNYMNILNCPAFPANSWYAGANSTVVSSSNWIVSAAPTASSSPFLMFV